jgi:hypothetical protein
MKRLLALLISGVFYCPFVMAQSANTNNTPAERHIRIKYITTDSINMALNEEFELIEDSCSQVIRYGHMDRKVHKFFGKFKDISPLDTALVLTEGDYTADGLKDGYFVTHYLNGNLQAKGSFKNNEFDGKWEVYYDDGKPKVVFEAKGKDISVLEAWNAKAVKVVDNGKGTFRTDNMGPVYWEGKLVNGNPDGSWSAIKINDPTQVSVVTEKYKDGVFQKGTGPLGDYNDAPRAELISTDMLPFIHAEKLYVSRTPCDGAVRKHMVRVQFPNGKDAFFQYVKDVLRPMFKRFNIRQVDNIEVSIEGEIAENGLLLNLTSNSLAQGVAGAIIYELKRLPPFIPATINGKPARERIFINFEFTEGHYHFTYHFGPVETIK